MLLLLDNYDSFTYNLYDYFVRCGTEVEVIQNDQIKVNTIGDKYTGIILSPGPGTPQESGRLMDVIHLYHDKLPIFGVCLGMQAIGTYFGAKLIRASFPMHGKQDEISYTKTHPMFNQIEEPLTVCRYHSLILTEIEGKDLVGLAYTQKNELMALAHASLPIWAVQFHPEAILTSQGLTIIDNWLSFFTLHSTKLARV